jgi:hypothetical protein
VIQENQLPFYGSMDYSKSGLVTLNKIKILDFNRKYTKKRRAEAAGDVKLTSPNNYRRYVMLMFINGCEAH